MYSTEKQQHHSNSHYDKGRKMENEPFVNLSEELYISMIIWHNVYNEWTKCKLNFPGVKGETKRRNIKKKI